MLAAGIPPGVGPVSHAVCFYSDTEHVRGQGGTIRVHLVMVVALLGPGQAWILSTFEEVG